MSLSDVFFVGKTVYVTTVHEASPDQIGTPSTVTATITLEKPDGTVVTPAPTATVTVNAGVATVTWSQAVGSTSTLAAGTWKFRVVTADDLIDAYEGTFYIRESQLV